MKLKSNISARHKSHEHQAAIGHVLLVKQGYPRFLFRNACANRCVGDMKDHRVLYQAGSHVRTSDTRKAWASSLGPGRDSAMEGVTRYGMVPRVITTW